MDNQMIDITTENNMKELATHIVSEAPVERVKTFSIDFLIQSFKNDLKAYKTAWVEYQSQVQEGKNEWDQLKNSKVIDFPQKGDSNVN